MARLRDICKFQSGGTPSKSNPLYFGGTIPWITTVALNGSIIDENNAVDLITEKAIAESAAKVVPANSIMIGTRVGIGKVAINSVPMSTNQDIISLLEVDETIWNKAFICKCLSAQSDYLQSQARGATIKGIKIETISDLEIPEIPIENQLLISVCLDRVAQLISLRKQQLAKLDELVKARFVEMFAGEDFPMVCISEVVDRNIVTAKKRFSSTDTIKYVDISSIDNQTNTMTGYTEYIFSDAPSRAQQCIETGDILISTVRPNLKNIALNRLNHKNLVVSSGFCVLRPVACQPSYLLAIVLSEKFTNDMVKVTTGANYPAVKDSDILKYNIPLAPDDQQQQFALFADKVDQQKLTIQQSLDKLEVLKKSLMQEYFG